MGAPKKVGGNFTCSHTRTLKSLAGISKEIKGDLNCADCGKVFKGAEIKKLTNVGGNINNNETVGPNDGMKYTYEE